MNKVFIGIFVIAISAGLYFAVSSYREKEIPTVVGYRNAEFSIEGQQIKLGADATYFGNELKTDLDGDGREDVAFVITRSPGGSGTFYYAVAALNTERGYVGSDGYLLGDRIAPQSTTLSPNPRHVRVVVFNYADRAANEPMTALPSIGKSAFLKLNPSTMQWAIVEPDFEGESR